MGLSVKVINGITAIKESDTLTDMRLRLLDGKKLAVDLTGKTVKIILANATGKILEKNAVLGLNKGEVVFGLAPADVTGYGQMFLEVHVFTGTERMIFPSDGYVPVKIDRNLTALGVVVPTVTIEAFEMRVSNLETNVATALTNLANDKAAYDNRFAVYEAQYNSMLNLANNVNAAVNNVANAANDYIVRGAVGADVTHKVTTDLAGKVPGSNTVNPHAAYSSTVATTLTAPTGTWTEVNAAAITSLSTLNGVSATYTSALTAGRIAQFRMSFDLIQHVERRYGFTIPGDLAAKVSWIKMHLPDLTLIWRGRGAGPLGNKASVCVWRPDINQYHEYKPNHTSASITAITYVINASVGLFIDNNGFIHFIAYADAASASVASSIITDYFSLDVTLTANFTELAEGQTAEEYRINVLNPPKKTGLLPYVIGGNVTTNTQRLQAMLAFLNTKGYGNLYFPNLGIDGIGNGRFYEINDTLKMEYVVDWAIPITLQGEDYGSYINMQDSTKPVIWINGVNNVRDFRIKNLTTKGGSYGVRIRWGAYVYIEDLNIRGCSVACMRFENTFGFCKNVWMFHTSSRLVEATGNGHIRWDISTFGEDAGGFYLEDTVMSFNNCKFLELKTYDTALTETGIGGGDNVTGTKTRAIFYTLFNVQMWFVDCDFIHNEVESYLFYHVNSPSIYRFTSCDFEVGPGCSLWAFRNPSVYQFKTGLLLDNCDIDNPAKDVEIYSMANSDAIHNLTITRTRLPDTAKIEEDPNSPQLYDIFGNTPY